MDGTTNPLNNVITLNNIGDTSNYRYLVGVNDAAKPNFCLSPGSNRLACRGPEGSTGLGRGLHLQSKLS